LVLRLLDLINVSAFLLPLHAGGTKIIAPKLLFATDRRRAGFLFAPEA